MPAWDDATKPSFAICPMTPATHTHTHIPSVNPAVNPTANHSDQITVSGILLYARGRVNKKELRSMCVYRELTVYCNTIVETLITRSLPLAY